MLVAIALLCFVFLTGFSKSKPEHEAAEPGSTAALPMIPGLTPDQQEVVAKGRKIADSHHCMDCHTLDGTPSSGPSWKGLYGSTRVTADGEKVKIDEKDMREVIRTVMAKFYKPYLTPFKDNMPGYELTDEELADVIDYIKLIK
jgi:cytochrome c oxidase subunit 2